MDLEIGKCSFTEIARGVSRVLVPGICMVETESGEAGRVTGSAATDSLPACLSQPILHPNTWCY